MSAKPVVEPAWLTINETARYAGCGRSGIYKALSAGLIEGRRAFGRSLILRESVDRYLANAPRLNPTAAAD